MPRVIWKGAISFGLVHVPVALYPGAQDTGIDFDWLDERSMDPVGYLRINKRTGKPIDKEHVVRGLKQDDGDYVVLGEDEINAAYPKSTQLIEIEDFVQAGEIPFAYLEKPYLLAPIGKGDKVYALLREAMVEAGVIAIARVVMHTKESLAALIPDGDALLMNTLRWARQVRDREGLKLPPAGRKAAGLKDAELKMASQLVTGMVTAWDPSRYDDRFSDAIHALAAKKVEAGETAQVAPLERADDAAAPSNVVDLSELLKRSLAHRTPAAPSRAAPRRTAASASTRAAPAKRAAAAKKTAKPARKAA